MKPTLCPTLLKTALSIAPLILYFGGSMVLQAGDKSVPSSIPVKRGHLAYRAELAQGFLKVYSGTNGFNDRNGWYFPHSIFAIYTIDGKLFKNVQSQQSADDVIPEVVALPVGTYTVVAGSETDGYVRAPAVINEGQRTILDLDLFRSVLVANRFSGPSCGRSGAAGTLDVRCASRASRAPDLRGLIAQHLGNKIMSNR
jgi:hypothetical protein